MPSTIVLISGANSGVGLATTKVIASSSPDFHIILASRTLEKAQGAKSEILAEYPNRIKEGQLSTIQPDVTKREHITQAAKFVQETFGHLDVLINNAAVGNGDPDVEFPFSVQS